jgi:hypothetical protein
LDFETSNIKEIEEIKELFDEELIEKYKQSCYQGRSVPLGLKPNGDLFVNGNYISTMVSEMKQRNFHHHLMGCDLNKGN